jgi:hypothetical protein
MSDRPDCVDDQMTLARLAAAALRHARWMELTADEATAALAELRELAAGRGDLLAEAAGIFLGAHQSELDEPHTSRAAQLCIAAQADRTLSLGRLGKHCAAPRWRSRSR